MQKGRGFGHSLTTALPGFRHQGQFRRSREVSSQLGPIWPGVRHLICCLRQARCLLCFGAMGGKTQQEPI